MKIRFTLLSVFIILNTCLSAQTSFVFETFIDPSGAELMYRLLKPAHSKKSKKYPLVIFLHGAGERGDDNLEQLTHGAALFEDKRNRRKFPAYVLFPQCPAEAYWATRNAKIENKSFKFGFDYSLSPGLPLQQVFDLIELYKILPSVDSNRIYIMGLSMGGMGTLEAISRHPELFAAAIPICGGGDLSYVKNFASVVPVWIFHGAKDDVVSPEYSRNMVRQIVSEGGSPRYTEYPEANHNSWDAAFRTPDLLNWLFNQKKNASLK